MAIDTVIFDLGGVLLDYNPRYLYKKIFNGDSEAVESFLSDVCTHDWNVEQDAGRPFAEATALLKEKFPEKAEAIDAFDTRWLETINGTVEGSVEILRQLKKQGTPIYALTNFSAEKFPIAQKHFPVLTEFDGIVVSGEEKLIKPDPRIYQVLLERFQLNANSCIFIDDSLKNVQGSKDVGIEAIHFQSPQQLRQDLQNYSLI